MRFVLTEYTRLEKNTEDQAATKVHVEHGVCNKVHWNYVKCIIVNTHITLEVYRLD